MWSAPPTGIEKDAPPCQIEPRPNLRRRVAASLGQLVLPVHVCGVSHDKQAAMLERQRHRRQSRVSAGSLAELEVTDGSERLGSNCRRRLQIGFVVSVPAESIGNTPIQIQEHEIEYRLDGRFDTRAKCKQRRRFAPWPRMHQAP